MVDTTATSTLTWNFDVAAAPKDGTTRILVAYRDGDTAGTCEATWEVPFAYGEAPPGGWYTMGGDANSMGDASVPGTVYAWTPKPAAPHHFK